MLSSFKTLRNNIFWDYSDLYIKCNKRISYKRYNEINQFVRNSTAKHKISFNEDYWFREFYYMLLKEYKDRKLISLRSYILSITFSSLRLSLKFIFTFLTKKEFDIFIIDKYDFKNNQLTITGGYKRLFLNLQGEIIEDIPVIRKIIKPSLKKRIIIFLLCFKYKIYNFGHVLQYYYFKKSLNNLNCMGKKFIVEEGQSIEQRFFLDFAKEKNLNLILTARGFPQVCRYRFGFKILTDNLLTSGILQKCNSDVEQLECPYFIDFKKLKQKSKTNKIGFMTPMGDLAINYHDKQIMDRFINEVSKESKISTILSIHPQERVKNSDYYKSLFDSDYIEIRKTETIEEYFNDIDILIGWSSTGIVQALVSKIPVILLDLFDDVPMEELVNYSQGLIRYVNNKQSFYNCYEYFYNISKEEKEKKYVNAMSSLNINIA